MEPLKYLRLTGWRRRLVSIDSLWRADDHILLVQRNGFTENYHRYYFANIQGFVVTPNSTAVTVSAVCAVPTVVAACTTALVALDQIHLAWGVAADILALPWLVVLVVNWLRGPTCTTHLCTAVGDVALVPLGRQRDALRVIPQLAAYIAVAQGRLEPERVAMLGVGEAAESGNSKVDA